MIMGRISATAQITVPRAVRLALGLEPGDEVGWEIDGERVVLTRVRGVSSVPPALMESLERGLADVEAGRTTDADIVFDRLEEKYRLMAAKVA